MSPPMPSYYDREDIIDSAQRPQSAYMPQHQDNSDASTSGSARHNDQLPTQPMSDSSLPTSTTAAWPKRVSKACCGCRRDKIRCDGERPCQGCLKKGIDILCIDGCAPCRRAREVCDGKKPCTKCENQNIECIDDPTPPLSVRTDIFTTKHTTSSQMKGRAGDRAKLACLACRRDNKKCEDQRPCARCTLRQEECVHVTRGPKTVKSRCKVCRDQNRRCEDVRPCRYCAEVGEQCFDVPRKGRGHGTRVKAACMMCRRNKIQCGSERPCKNCAKRGHECVERPCTCGEEGNDSTCHNCRPRKTVQQVEDGASQYLPFWKTSQEPTHPPNTTGVDGAAGLSTQSPLEQYSSPAHLPPNALSSLSAFGPPQTFMQYSSVIPNEHAFAGMPMMPYPPNDGMLATPLQSQYGFKSSV